MKGNLKGLEKELRNLLAGARGHMGRSIRYLLANRNELPIRSMRELAKRADVPPVTLVRLAQRLGFEGFDTFREAYVEALMASAGRNPEQAARLISLGRSAGSLGFAAKFVESELEIQRQTLSHLTEKQLDAAVRDLVAAERIFVAGRRPLFASAYSFAYALRKAKPNTHLLDIGGGMGTELDDLSHRDIFVGFSFHPYSRVTLGLAEVAGRQGAKVIAITDSAQSPIGRIADHRFITLVQGYAFPDSTTGAQTIGHILIGLIVTKMGAEALARIAANAAQIKSSGELVG